MKYHESAFEEYIQSHNIYSLHKAISKNYNKYPDDIEDAHNLIFYGPCGCGKYTQSLIYLKKYSPSELKYEKRISFVYNKVTQYYKISDIHMEVDMGLLGCHSKILWHEIFTQYLDIINAKPRKVGYILCKNFHEIHNELLDIFYSYMQSSGNISVIKFIIISESISFIPDNILNCCEMINIPRPSRLGYSTCIGKKLPGVMDLSTIDNIKTLRDPQGCLDMYNSISLSIIDIILSDDNVKFLEFRDKIYDIFTYNIDINKCIWNIIKLIFERYDIEDIKCKGELFSKTYEFFKYFNNNYRPIYHLESYFFYLRNVVKEIKNNK